MLEGLTWVITAIVVGMLLGSIKLYIRRRRLAQAAVAAQLISLVLFGPRFL
jgi:hypothetical protein